MWSKQPLQRAQVPLRSRTAPQPLGPRREQGPASQTKMQARQRQAPGPQHSPPVWLRLWPLESLPLPQRLGLGLGSQTKTSSGQPQKPQQRGQVGQPQLQLPGQQQRQPAPVPVQPWKTLRLKLEEQTAPVAPQTHQRKTPRAQQQLEPQQLEPQQLVLELRLSGARRNEALSTSCAGVQRRRVQTNRRKTLGLGWPLPVRGSVPGQPLHAQARTQ